MRKIAFIIFIIILLNNGSLFAAGQNTPLSTDYLYYAYINNAFFNSYGDFHLTEYQLRLPENRMELSPEAQDELLNLAALYANRTITINKEPVLNNLSQGLENSLIIDRPAQEDRQESLVLKPLPGVLVNADFKQEEKEDWTIEENTNISLQYWMNNRTLIRAEYDLASTRWWDTQAIVLNDEDEQREEDINNDNDDKNYENPERQKNEGEMIPDEGYNPQKEAIFNREISEKSRLGISYKTTDRITVSADYIDGDEEGLSDFSTILGVEYADDTGLIRYHYQIDFDEMDFSTIRKMASGVEFGIRDQAIFNASYQLLKPEDLENQLQGSVWDFGLDLNLTDITTLSLGYQFTKPDDDVLELNTQQEKESNIKAQFEIKF